MRTNADPEGTTINQKSAAVKAPNTVIQTPNIDKVKEKVSALVLDCQTNDNKFIDPDFNPEDGDHSLLYKEQDTVSVEEAAIIDKLKWLRPNQISAKTDIQGFLYLQKEGNLETLDNCNLDELADFRRISYGVVLENRWFLNALSLVASEERQLN